MPKFAIPLTEQQLVGLAPKDRLYKVGDGHGLYLLAEPTGKKRWRMSFHLRGKENTVTFGDYPAMSLADGARAVRLCEPTHWARHRPGRIETATTPTNAGRHANNAEIPSLHE